jgi:ribosomal protein S14
MKHLIKKDKKFRKTLKNINLQYFILQSIFKNTNLFTLHRWNAYLKLQGKQSRISLVPRCQITINRKRFNKFTNFSRHLFLKLIRLGKISGFKKISW